MRAKKAKEAFKFTDVINIENTSVKAQGSSGTCWSYSANSFLESEMIRMGKKPVELSQIFSARNAYVEKGRNYVRMHGAVTLGDGGAFHDVINMYRKYGAVPQSVYTGLNYGTDKNKFGEMAALGEALLAAVVKATYLPLPDMDGATTRLTLSIPCLRSLPSAVISPPAFS